MKQSLVPSVRKIIPILIISAVMLVANIWHVLASWVMNPNGRIFIGIAHYYQDYFLYSSYIEQGVMGSWFWAHHMYTDEHLSTFWYYWLYVFLGHVGGWFHANAFVIYDVSLVMFSVMLLFLLYLLLRRLFTTAFSVTVAFLFTATASNFINVTDFLHGKALTLTGLDWFSPTPALNRLGGVPHQILQTVDLVAIALLVLPVLTKHKLNPVRATAIALLSFYGATTNPVQMLLLSGAIGVTATIPVLKSLIDKKRIVWSDVQQLADCIVYVILPFGIGTLITNHEIGSIPMFAGARSWELQQWDFPDRQFATIMDWFVSLGPILILLPFGVKRYVTKIDPLRLILLLCAVFSVAAFFSPLPQLAGVARSRWLSPFAYLAFPVLAADGFFEIIRIAKNMHVSRFFVSMGIVTVYLIFTIPALIAQVEARISPVGGFYLYGDLNHVTTAAMSAFSYLSGLPGNGFVVTDPTLPYDIIVPPITGKPSFTGHVLHTLNRPAKEQLRKQFFSGDMQETDAKTFIASHRIGYILASSENTDVLTAYPFLTKRYDAGGFIIYTAP